MEDVRTISLALHDAFCKEIKKFEPYSKMTDEELEKVAEPMFDVIWKGLEDYSNGYYANEN